MRFDYHKNFKKQYKKFPKTIRQKCDQRLIIFAQNPFDPLLYNHPLLGKYRGYRSINITADIRALYKLVSEDEASFVFLGTHSELYS